MNLLKKLLSKRVYFLADNKLFELKNDKLNAVPGQEWGRINYSILIIGREHLIEQHHKFPVVDSKEIKSIVKNQFSDDFMISPPVISDKSSQVTAWQLRPEASQLLEKKVTIWLPETILLEMTDAEHLNCISRAGNTIFAIKQSNQKFTSDSKGAFADPQYFLMTLGLSSAQQVAVNEHQYCLMLNEALTRLSPQQWLSVLTRQVATKNTVLALPWRLAGIGLVAGWLFVFAVDLAQLHLRLKLVEDEIASQDVAAVMRTKQEIEGKMELTRQFADGAGPKSQDAVLWQVLGLIMEQGIKIIRFRTNAEGVELRLESKIATESLEIVKSIPLVEDARFAAAVQNSLGNQRSTVIVKFAEKTSVESNG